MNYSSLSQLKTKANTLSLPFIVGSQACFTRKKLAKPWHFNRQGEPHFSSNEDANSAVLP